MFLISPDFWEIRETKKKGRGVFAKKKIAKGTVIGDYIGTVLRTAEYDLDLDRDGLYLMYLTDEASIYPDLTKSGIHLFNHACIPSCWMYTQNGHTLFFALREIQPNEELTIAYLLSPKTKGCAPCTHVCKCGEVNCTGSMHLPKKMYKKWQEFQAGNNKNAKKAHFTFGKTLPRLRTYPKRIPISPIYKEMFGK